MAGKQDGTMFLDQKESQYGKYYSKKIGEDYLNVDVKSTGEAMVKFKGAKTTVEAKSNDYGQYWLLDIDGVGRFFANEGKSEHGPYMRLKPAPDRAPSDRPDNYGSRQ